MVRASSSCKDLLQHVFFEKNKNIYNISFLFIIESLNMLQQNGCNILKQFVLIPIKVSQCRAKWIKAKSFAKNRGFLFQKSGFS
jgi:hypothetical protein